MSQETERRQGIFVIASFDRMFTRERKTKTAHLPRRIMSA